MEASQQPSESPVQHIVSYNDGFDHSWSPMLVNISSASQDTHEASQTDGFSRSNAFVSPLASPTSHKRKRLVKACDACHRSKRRCDGTALCANCEFAGKACTYTDPLGRTVAPPRSRRIVGRRSGLEGGQPYPVANPTSGDPNHVPLRMATPVPTTSDAFLSPLDATLTQELVNLFFAHCHPATFIIHRPNFLYDLARSQVPAYLLLSVFAVAAPWSRRPSLRSNPSWHAGEVFAIQAAKLLSFDDSHHVSNLPDSVDSLRIKPCLEVAQALCLLRSHENVMRRRVNSDRLLVLVQDVLDVLDMAIVDIQPTGVGYASYVRNESLCRVFWFSYLSAVLTQHSLPTLGNRLEQLRLPVQEALFDMPRVENRLGMAPAYDYLTLPAEPTVCLSEFGNLVRVSWIYAGVVNAVTQKEHALRIWKQGQTSMPENISLGSLEVDLRKWLELLPDNLRLTEDNLQVHAQLDGGAGTAAWAFGYMHMLAEATVLALHQFANFGTQRAQRHSPREQKALDNLTMIMEMMGQRARTNFEMARPLVAIGRHTAQQLPQFGSWFEEFHQMWGTTYEELMNIESRTAWATSMMANGEQSTSGLPTATLYKTPTSDALLNLAKFGEDGMTGERFGTLAMAAAVNGLTSSDFSVPASTQEPLRGFIGRRHGGQGLPSIVTSGLPARLERQFYGDATSLSDGRGESEGSEHHSLGESPTAPRVTTVASQQHALEGEVHAILTSSSTQLIETSQYRSRTSTHSVLSYGNLATLAEAGLGDGTDLSWLEDDGT